MGIERRTNEQKVSLKIKSLHKKNLETERKEPVKKFK
jgi:hypothetical protein